MRDITELAKDEIEELVKDYQKPSSEITVAQIIEKYDLNTTDERRLDRFTQEGPSQIPWGLPLVEDKDQTNYNKKLASILPPHNLDSSFNKRNSEKELTGKQKNDFIKKAMKMQGYNDKEANQMVNQSRKVR